MDNRRVRKKQKRVQEEKTELKHTQRLERRGKGAEWGGEGGITRLEEEYPSRGAENAKRSVKEMMKEGMKGETGWEGKKGQMMKCEERQRMEILKKESIMKQSNRKHERGNEKRKNKRLTTGKERTDR